MRIMAIDYGDARTGVAISDATGLLAGYTTVLPSRSREAVLEELAKLVKTYGVEELVMGFPRNMDGPRGRGQSSTGRLRTSWGRVPDWSPCCGMNEGRLWRPTQFSTPEARR